MLVTAKDVARMTKLSRRSIFRHKDAKRMPKAIYIHGALRWKKSDIELWVEMGCPSQGSFEERKQYV